MQESIIRKLESLCERHQEVEQLLSQPEIIADQEKFRELNREYSRLQVMVNTFQEYKRASDDLEEMQVMLEGDDEDMKAMAQEELEPTKEKAAVLEHELQLLLLPHDDRDDCNCFLEIRAGTGGDEAALFAGELYRMYAKYCESKGWQLEVVSQSEGEVGGYKEIIAKLSGEGAYGYMKFESGGHRVQRVPATEAQGRVHTSACTVMVLPEILPIYVLILSAHPEPAVSTLIRLILQFVLHIFLPVLWLSAKMNVLSIVIVREQWKCCYHAWLKWKKISVLPNKQKHVTVY